MKSKWIEIPLGEYAKITMGQSPKSEYYNENKEGTPFLQGNKTFGTIYPTFEKYTTKITKLAKKNEILFSVRAPVGEINIAPEQLCIGRGLAALSSSNNLFLYYLLKYNQNRYEGFSSGTVFSSINKNTLNKILVNIPDLETQKKITSVLWSLDSKIELNNQMIDTLEEIASTLFKRWFVDFEFPDENGNPYKSSGGKMIDSELGEIPEGWEIKQLGEIGVINKGLSYKSKFLDQENKNNKSIPFFSLSNFDVNGQIKFDKMKYYFGEYKDKDIVTENDLLIAMTDLTQKRLLLGSCILVPKLGDDMIFSLDIAKYTTDYFLKNYIYNFLKLPKYKLQIENYATGTTVTRISMKDINTIKVVLPESLVLESFNDIVNHHYKLIEELRTNKFLTEQLRDTILPKLLSGEIEV